uniref:Uncharacterized protein n=1 Tax=Entomoneis paludosa TaxID=265537 RepID=A0A7S2VEL8_9STRA|mmetsp:Transcript_15642/g.32362  ORF Transcript_15642/g.32362 Transcript_15642/m.32362 type:complete len:229 (+) Transcript_15642:795-1481(+)
MAATTHNKTKQVKRAPTKKSSSATSGRNHNKKKSAGGGLTHNLKILRALALQYALGQTTGGVDKKRVQGMAGIVDKKVFDTVAGILKNKKGWIQYDSKTTMSLTEAGREEVERHFGPDELKVVTASNDMYHDKIKEGLKSAKSREIFDLLKDGKAYTKEEMANALGLEINKSFGTYLSGLSRFTEKMAGGQKYRLSDDVFPCGRPTTRIMADDNDDDLTDEVEEQQAL